MFNWSIDNVYYVSNFGEYPQVLVQIDYTVTCTYGGIVRNFMGSYYDSGEHGWCRYTPELHESELLLCLHTRLGDEKAKIETKLRNKTLFAAMPTIEIGTFLTD